jgi:hypothetical protein
LTKFCRAPEADNRGPALRLATSAASIAEQNPLSDPRRCFHGISHRHTT